jgi:WD40 repeat protein
MTPHLPTQARQRPSLPLRLLPLVALLSGACSSPEEAVLATWNEYHHAMRRGDLPAVRSLLAAGRDAELAGPEAPAALELRSALVPEAPAVTGTEVSAVRASITVEGSVDGMSMCGRISFTKESGGWKVLEESWNADLTNSFPVPDVDLALTVSTGSHPPQLSTEIAAHEGEVRAMAFTRDGRCVVSIGYGDQRVRLWDSLTGVLLGEVQLESRPCDLALRPDGTAAYVVDTDGRVTEWPIEWGAFGEPRVLAGLAGESPRIAVDGSGRYAVTTSWVDPAKLWDLESGTFVRALPKSEKMRGVAFSPAGPVVACGSYTDHFAVWELDRLSSPLGARKKHRVPKVGDQSDVWSIAYSPDGRRLATGHMDSSMSIWDMERGRQLHNWYVQDCSVRDLEFSPCGTVLATAQQDGKVHLWETETRRALARLPAHQGSASSVAFNPADGVTIATGGEDGAIRIWR